MELSLLLINFLAVGYVCILPFIFFKKDGTFNLLWLLTAAPYVAFELFFLANHFGYVNSFEVPVNILPYLTAVSVIFCVLGISIISQTIGTHSVPLALWHQDNDAPVNIIKRGPYSKVRHPFYTSFILIMIAGCLAYPHYISFGITLYGLIILTLTAKKEEGKLSASKFGQEYIDYMKVTGRFFPKVL